MSVLKTLRPIRNTRRLVLALLASLLTPLCGDAGSRGGPWEWEDVERVVAIGDVHGSYGKLISLLRGTGLTDLQLSWTGGEAHLVFCGDLVDRGPEERAVLDLVRRLQAEAAAAGGRVHALLGNHEVMNMAADLRYVPPGGFGAFVDEERAEDRQEVWKRFAKSARGSRQPASFDERYPPGFFGRMLAFGPSGEYGRWLVEQPTIVKINGTLFVHGGLSDRVAPLGLAEINSRVRRSIEAYWAERQVLTPEVGGAATFSALARTATRLAEGQRGSSQRESARKLLELRETLAFAPDGPQWHRGFSLSNERFARVPLERVLRSLESRAMVVAHTPTGSGKITSRFNGQLYRSDVGMAYGRDPSALVFEGSDVRVFDAANQTFSRPLQEHPSGEGWRAGHEQLPDHQLERFLAKAKIVDRREIERPEVGRHVSLLELERKRVRLRGIFHFVDEGLGGENPRRYQHEVAAYWLDRRLGLRLTPVAVRRKVDGQKGTLVVYLESAIDLEYIRSHDLWAVLEGLEDQIGRVRVLVALVGARERHDAARMLLPMERRVMIADNTKGFPLTTTVADLLTDQFETTDRSGESRLIQGAPCRYLDAGLAAGLRSLGRKELGSELDDYLSPEQIEALLARRDGILEFCASRAESKSDAPPPPGETTAPLKQAGERP